MDLHNVDREGLRACLYGLAVGDALGVPYEFRDRSTFYCKGMIGGGTWEQPAGTYSDDTGMTLAMLDSISTCGRVDQKHMMGRFRSWRDDGKYMPDGKTFDVGRTIDRAITAGEGMRDVMDNGNGSLMRTAPLAFLSCTDAEISAVSSVTHAHAISVNACITFVRLLEEARRDMREAKAKVREMGIAGKKCVDIKSSAYVMHTLEAALWCFSRATTYRDCVLKAVNLGKDTDTTACVAGALAATAYGIDSIPEEWVDTLRGKEHIEAILRKF